jgi:hypothetical protein
MLLSSREGSTSVRLVGSLGSAVSALVLFSMTSFGCGTGVGVVPVTPALVARAKVTWPAATEQGLEHGRTTMIDHCGACHSLPDPALKSAAEWPMTLDDMAKRAGLTPAERDDVQHYLLAAHP